MRDLPSGIAVDDKSWKIEFTRAEKKQEKGKWSARDTDRARAEHDASQQLEPERAQQIDAAAHAEGETAQKD